MQLKLKNELQMRSIFNLNLKFNFKYALRKIIYF